MLRAQTTAINQMLEANRQQIQLAQEQQAGESRINELFEERRQLLDANTEAQGAMMEAMGTQSQALEGFADRIVELLLTQRPSRVEWLLADVYDGERPAHRLPLSEKFIR